MFRPINSNFEDIVIYFASILQPENYLELGILRGDRITKVLPFVSLAVGVDMNVPELSGNYKFYHMTTDEFFEKLHNKDLEFPLFDMVFIDADHSHEQSIKDFLNVVPYVEENGLIFMHDTYPRNQEDTNLGVCGEVYITAKQIHTTPDYEIVTIPIFPGMSIIRKAGSQIPWGTNG